MDTSKMLPVPWLRGKGIEMVAGDTYYYRGAESTLDWDGAESVNTCALYDDPDCCIISFVDRENTGGKPVCDSIKVDVKFDYGRKDTNKSKECFVWSLRASPSIKTWKPNFDFLHELYIKEKETPRVYNKPKCYAQSSKNSPVFTQAMKDERELPPIGCECELVYDHPQGDKYLTAGTRVYIGGHANFNTGTQDGENVAVFIKVGSHNTGTGVASRFKPILTDEEKLRDALIWETGEFNADRLLSSDKFTITLNKDK